MYRKRRMAYIICFIFIPCIIVPLIYMSYFFYEFKSRVFNEISFTAETEDGETYNLRAKYDKDSLLYSVNVPNNAEISDIIINTADRGVFEINDVIYENGSTIADIEYNTEYDIKMYTEDNKLLNEASLIFNLDTETPAFSYNPNDENAEIISTAEDGRLPSPEEMDRPNRQGGERGFQGGRNGRTGFNRQNNRPVPVYEIGLGLVFALCCLYLLYRQIIVNGGIKKGGRRK